MNNANAEISRVLASSVVAQALVLSATLHANADDRTGTQTVVCRTQGRITKVHTVLAQVAEEQKALTIDFGPRTNSVRESVAYALERWAFYDPARVKSVGALANQLINTIESLEQGRDPGNRLVDFTTDTIETIPPKKTYAPIQRAPWIVPRDAGCEVEQITVQQTPRFPQQFRFTLNRPQWEFLTANRLNDVKAMVVLNEALAWDNTVGFSEVIAMQVASSRFNRLPLNSYIDRLPSYFPEIDKSLSFSQVFQGGSGPVVKTIHVNKLFTPSVVVPPQTQTPIDGTFCTNGNILRDFDGSLRALCFTKFRALADYSAANSNPSNTVGDNGYWYRMPEDLRILEGNMEELMVHPARPAVHELVHIRLPTYQGYPFILTRFEKKVMDLPEFKNYYSDSLNRMCQRIGYERALSAGTDRVQLKKASHAPRSCFAEFPKMCETKKNLSYVQLGLTGEPTIYGEKQPLMDRYYPEATLVYDLVCASR
jgi:hypothetical protein